MTANFSYAPSAKTETNSKSSRKIEKGLKRLLIIAGIVFSAELVWLFVISPFIPFSTIEVQTFAGLNRADVLKTAAIDDTSSFVSTNVAEIQKKLSSLILVSSVKVTKRFPDKLTISLVPRKAAAVTLANINGKQVPLFIDSQGVFFKIGNSLSGDAAGLPVISGIENPQMYMQLPASLVPLTEKISAIAGGSPELLSAISEIRIEQKSWEGYDLVLYPVHSSIKVRIENNLTEEILRYMLLMLNVFEQASQKPREIDFRSGIGSYKIKENS
ncbi:MAG: FtsQ-type POTRA domain-containing protein [Treponema sp.]|jgi:cell division protein FtsQ|nr:FtsQ-type POTRA domain-containing protein [Treponema sp.]